MGRFWVTSIFLIGGFSLTYAAQLECYNSTDLSKYEVATLENPESLIISNCLISTLCTIIYAFGSGGRKSGPASTNFLETFLNLQFCNIILVNWEKEAKNGTTALDNIVAYGVAAANTKVVGDKLGGALIRLGEYNLNLGNVHLIGHSLGAHLMGYAAKKVKNNGTCVKLLTGLDPALPLFNSPLSTLKAIDSTSSCFVVCFHTDPGTNGLNKTCGNVDIWFNHDFFVNGTNRQPGCDSNMCNHDRSWQIHNLAYIHKDLFIASKAANVFDWQAQNGASNNTINLGPNIDYTAFGNYFLRTTGVTPYGKGKDGTKP